MSWKAQVRPLMGTRRKVEARPISYKHDGKRLYSGVLDGKYALFVGCKVNGKLGFQLVTAA